MLFIHKKNRVVFHSLPTLQSTIVLLRLNSWAHDDNASKKDIQYIVHEMPAHFDITRMMGHYPWNTAFHEACPNFFLTPNLELF